MLDEKLYQLLQQLLDADMAPFEEEDEQYEESKCKEIRKN